MFTPASYNEDKSDVGGHTTIQLLFNYYPAAIPQSKNEASSILAVIPAGIDGRNQNLRRA